MKKTKGFKARTICFTVYQEDALRDPQKWLEDLHLKCDWVLAQKEKCPKTGKEHLQGMAFSKENMSWGFMKPNHIEKTQDPLKSVEYCSKTESRMEGPWEYGVRPSWNIKGQKLTNMELLKRPLTELIEEERIHLRDYKKIKENINAYLMDKKELEDRRNYAEQNVWIFGPPGVGKSHWVREKYPGLYMKSQNKWWDGYTGQETVLIDDFDRQGVCLSHHLKIWADSYSLTGEIKGSTIPLTFKRLIITSNYPPEKIWTDDQDLLDAISRRFKIIEIKERKDLDSI